MIPETNSRTNAQQDNMIVGMGQDWSLDTNMMGKRVELPTGSVFGAKCALVLGCHLRPADMGAGLAREACMT